MNSKDYWAEREAEQLKHNITDEVEYDKQIKRIYTDMLDGIQKEINSFYGRYADKEGITLAEAKKRVSQLDIAEYERKAKRYVRDKDFSAQANEEMRLYNATMKINRLEMLKANIGLELISGSQELENFMRDILKGRTEDELRRQAGILGKTIKNNAQKANAIVNGSFQLDSFSYKGKRKSTFSEAIWQYQELMRYDIGELLRVGLIRGKNPNALATDLKKMFYGGDPKKDGGYNYCAKRLMRTELARVQTEAQKQSFVRNGFEEYTFITNGGCCPICAGLDGKHFKVSKMMPGTNAPPMHPHCRCSTAAYEDSQEYENWLDFLDKGGTTEEYNKLQAIRNDADRQAEIKARREAYHKRNAADTSLSAEDYANKIGAKHGINIDINEAGKLTEEAKAQITAIDELMTEYNSTMVSYKIEKGSFFNSEGGQCYMLNGKSAVSVKAQAIKRNMNGQDTLKLGNKSYLHTTYHEFAHSLSQSREKTDPTFWQDLKKVRTKYRKAIKDIDKAEIVDHTISATQAMEAKKKIFISDYAEKDIDEFLADAFSMGKLSSKPSPYAKEVVDVVDKYFKKKTPLTNSTKSDILKKVNKSLLPVNVQLFANKGIKRQSDNGLNKSIASWKANIEKHKAKLKNPAEFDVDWDKKTDIQKAGLLKHWEKEIKIFEKDIAEAEAELKKRGESNE